MLRSHPRGLNLPDEGNAELVFTVDESFSEALEISEEPEAIYFATLQMAQEAKRLGLGDGRPKQGLQAYFPELGGHKLVNK